MNIKQDNILLEMICV